jgi:type IV secretion system protein VirB10
MRLFNALKRYTSRVLGTARMAREAANREECGERLSVPGRQEATEATLSPLHLTTFSTPTILGLSLLAAAVLGWYYVHAYTRARAIDRDSAAHTAELADNPLPPLQHAEVPGRASAKADGRGYTIGDILNPNDDRAGADAATDAPGPETEVTADTDAVNVAHGSSLQLPQVRRLDGAVFTRTMRPPGETTFASADASLKSSNSSASANVEASSVDHLLRSEVTPTTAAAVLPTQRLLLPKGAFLDCTLETAIDSTLPGLTTCITAFDTFSADGTVVLLERGTKLIGEMRSQVQQGTARVFVLWTEARTPNGIVVALASPGTDELGRSGLAGTVDRHFADRFGAAILVSMIDGVIQSAVNHSQQNGGTVILNPSGAGDVATEVLRSTLNIPPTVRIPQGERIEVLVARDLDFRGVYSLHTR